MIGVCPSCGKPFAIKQAEGGEGWVYCEDVCISPADMPVGERLLADQATKVYVDRDMIELRRQEYIKKHGFDPQPVMDAVNNWREEQVKKWAASRGWSEEEIDAWIKQMSAKTL